MALVRTVTFPSPFQIRQIESTKERKWQRNKPRWPGDDDVTGVRANPERCSQRSRIISSARQRDGMKLEIVSGREKLNLACVQRRYVALLLERGARIAGRTFPGKKVSETHADAGCRTEQSSGNALSA